MKIVSFKGIYAVPISRSQNPQQTKFKNFTREVTPILNEGEHKEIYNENHTECYFLVQDRNDKIFESLARVNEIVALRISPKEFAHIKTTDKPESLAAKIKKAVYEAVSIGANYEIKNKNDIKTITIFEADGETIAGIYKFDNNKCGALIESQTYTDGKLESTNYFNEKGNKYRVTYHYGK